MSGDEPRDLYLVWSHEHSAWWGPERRGYVRKISEAGRYSRIEALNICAKAIPGTADRMRAYPELPVRLADVYLAQSFHEVNYPGQTSGEWEQQHGDSERHHRGPAGDGAGRGDPRSDASARHEQKRSG